jgi:DNA-directed RNA polymerase specialized sigma24 family protein
MDDSVTTSTAASWSDAPDLGEHIAATSVSYRINALESALKRSRAQTAAVDKAELNKRFELLVLPHLDSAYNLARWLLRDEQDAKDVAQEALLRAFRVFDQFRGIDARPWLLKIVRNTCLPGFSKSARRTSSAGR